MAAAEGERPLYKDASAPVDARVRDLLGRMTLREKAAQMAQIERTVVSPSALTELGVGSVLNAGGSAPRDRASPADWAGMVDDMQRLALSSRLAIPILYGTDAVHGHNNVFGATVFPHNVGLGASRDAELVRKIGKATALEVRATGIHWAFAPCVAVCRDPRWGRCYESYSEDPEIVRSLTTIVTGLQGQPPADHPHGQPFLASVRDNVLACAKHFVGDGGTAKGINEGNTICSPEDLERIHMTPYPDCMTQGVATVMASYSQWNGEPLPRSPSAVAVPHRAKSMWFCGSSPIMWGQQEEEEEDPDEHDSTQSPPTVWDENEEADDEHDARSPPTMWDEEENADVEHDTQPPPTMWGENEESDDEYDTQSPPTTWDENEEADDEYDTQSPPTMWDENEETDDEHGHDDNDVPSGSSEEGEPKFIEDKYRYSTVDEVITVLREAGLGSSNLIFGIDFTKSNDWSGKHSFGGESLHAISRTPNPYEQAISIIGRTLSPFDDDNLIPCFGFGDVSTCDHSVFNFYEEDRPCRGFEEVLDRYKQMIPYLDFSGPTSFAPLIYAAISVVERSNFQYHVLVIIADGQAATSKSYSILSPQEEETIQALVDASFYPLSIVMVGVGDGPWDEMKHVDDCIPDRAFHNFQFVNFTDIMSTSKDMEKKEAALAFAALMEIPAQYKATQCLQPPEWHEEMADPWMILPPPIEVLERDYAVAVSHFPAAPALSTGIGKDSSDEQVCPICLMNPKDMAFQCGHLLSLPSAALTGVGKGTSDEQLCPICLTNPKDMAFQCGHLTCKECGPTLSTCHLCRAPITVRLRLFS